MALLSFLRRLYSLDTLDTRFTNSSTTPPKHAAAESRIDPAKPSPSGSKNAARSDSRAPGPQPSKWHTPEFYLYYLVFLTAVPSMFYVVYDVSKESHPNYPKFEPLLSPGWIPGRKVDNSDGQYSSFRDNLPYLFVIALVHPFLRKAYDYLCRADTYTQVRQISAPSGHQLTQGLTAHAAADARLEQRVSFDFGFAIIFTFILHGFSALKVLLILYLNYKITTSLPKNYIPAATWVFNICALFSNEIFRGYPFTSIAAFVHGGDGSGTWGAWLDSYGGLNSRWEILFNITVLRLISFSMDYYWSLNMQGGSPIEKKQLDPSNLSERDRVSTPAKPGDYSFRNYVAYALYSPLYNAGPILTFNDYISQQRYCPPSITPERTTRYAFRFVLALLAMEVIIHYIYAVAIFHVQPDWDAYTPFQLSMLGFFNLHHIWLKLLLPWRFFRLWSLFDNIDPPENMVRCMSNNYSVMGFWRGWHRSYNRWLIRYIFIPMGGSGHGRSIFATMLNYLTIFTFVALWHDIQLRLLMWGWLITFIVAPEILASLVFPRRKWADRPNAYRVLCGIGAVAQILFMIAANLVGFAIGIDGLEGLAKAVFGSASGLTFFALACGALFVGVQVMFEIREQEAREGIRMKC
ncbi:MBOAT, membrane-bound O-acyltransferase family-domain-containing protein [Macrophomina phaseolina]|uniref:MBOAT, membrane-bound O-acyltransferase family-domain-containing protein n=1 Tax=Macrophomina phaseolina TaxID=35725 RepID=A0ABQ8G0C1_9PEZI|nr:MBOAT, membrane-bound O-acyltransferase family-domain-containing protein [Macrophomina phaseolina]